MPLKYLCTPEGGLNGISKGNIKSERCFKRTIQIPPTFFKIHRIPKFHDQLCKHALFTFYVKIISKKGGRFGNGFSREYDIFEISIKHLYMSSLKLSYLSTS